MFFNLPDLEMLFVYHASEVEYLRCMHEMLCIKIFSGSDIDDMLRCFSLVRFV